MWTKILSHREKSDKNERRLADELGFSLTRGSGCTAWPLAKGDGSHPRIMFECKETASASLSLGKRVVQKLCKEACAVGKEPALILSVYGLPDPIPKDWVVVQASFFKELLDGLSD